MDDIPASEASWHTDTQLDAAALARYMATHQPEALSRAQLSPLYLRAPDAKPQTPLLKGNSPANLA